MTDLPQPPITSSSTRAIYLPDLRRLVPVALVLASMLLNGLLWVRFSNYSPEDAIFRDSTMGELAVWMAGQAAEDQPESILGQQAKVWAAQTEANIETNLLNQMQVGLLVWTGSSLLLAGVGVIGLVMQKRWSRSVLLATLVMTLALLFNQPVVDGDDTLALILLSGLLLVGAVIFSPGPVTKLLGFVVILSLLLVGWETAKAFAAGREYQITTAVNNWAYTTFPTLDEALAAVESGEVTAIIANRNEVRDIIAPLPADPEIDSNSLPYPDLRYLTNLDTYQAILGIWPITPAYPGRLSVITRAETSLNHLNDLMDKPLGSVRDDFADERYLGVDRNLVLLDLKILNDINLPHLQNIAEALLQPARRNGPLLLVRILTDAALQTWGKAVGGFFMGAALGLILGTIFAHSAPLERGLLPYVVASQTVPILAIAPMIVIWLGAGPISVAVISAYLTFFPVTINTLRGLRSPHPNVLELMQSYAATRREILVKVRFPAALPYIFTALKVSATASVVGAIIGELPSSIRDGLGRAILDFSSDYSLVSTPKLWATILIAASVGILSFMIVSFVEYLVLRSHSRSQ